MKSVKKTGKALIVKIISAFIFAVLSICNLLPFVWGLSTSLKNTNEINTFPPKLIGSVISFEHYKTVWNSNFPTSLLNSIKYSLIAIIICAIVSTIFAYAYTRYDFKGKKIIFLIILFGIPLSLGSAALVVPNYLLFSYMHMVNKWYTLPLIYIAYNLPMACIVMIGGLENLPVAIEEAAAIDGASKWYIIFRLIPRMSMPSIACSSLLTFIGAWNEYTVSSVLTTSPARYPIQVSIYTYLGYFGREWGPLMASALLAVIPITIVFTFLGKLLISGLTAGAVKE